MNKPSITKLPQPEGICDSVGMLFVRLLHSITLYYHR